MIMANSEYSTILAITKSKSISLYGHEFDFKSICVGSAASLCCSPFVLSYIYIYRLTAYILFE